MSSSRKSRPHMACEISADSIVGARSSDHAARLEMFTGQQLPEGSVAPDLTEANVLRGDVLRESIREVMQTLEASSRDLIAILPDAAARVVLLDFDTLPERREEAEAVVRFRLKKSLPFDVDRAKLSYQAQTAGKGVKVVAAVALNSVVEEYESAFRDAGYSPGIVLPSMLAALGAVEANQPTMVVKVDAFTTSIAILDHAQLLLFRTLENTRGLGITGEQLAEDVYPSVVFFQDTYQLNIGRIYVAGLAESEDALRSLQAQTGVEVHELVNRQQLGQSGGQMPGSRLAGVVGALLG